MKSFHYDGEQRLTAVQESGMYVAEENKMNKKESDREIANTRQSQTGDK